MELTPAEMDNMLKDLDPSPAPLRLYDRSRTTTDWRCPMSRYWQYEYEGRGIVSSNTSLELFLGTVTHDGLAAIAHGVDIEEIALTARKQILDALLETTTGEVEQVSYAWEQATLVEGMLRGFYKNVWPNLMRTHPIILCVEEEMTYEHDGFTFMSKPDLVVQDEEGNAWYIEYKTTSYKREEWVNSWNTAIQLHSTCRAIEATKGVLPTGIIVQGLYKGYASYGKQNSPFCYAYMRGGNPPFTQKQVLYEYKAGFKRTPTWEMEGGVKQWIAEMPIDILTSQFPATPPIFYKDYEVKNFFAQRAVREMEIDMAMALLKDADDADVKQAILNTAFEQKFDQCYPFIGRPCQYLKLCHGDATDPLSKGYEFRQPHHALEMEGGEGQ